MYSRRARPGERPGTVGLGAVRGTIPDPGAIPIARHPPVARTHCRSDSNRPCVQLSTDYTLMHDAGCSATGLSSPHALTLTPHRHATRQRKQYGGPRHVSVTCTRHGIAGPRGTRRTAHTLADRQVTRTVREYVCVGFVHRRSFRLHTEAS